jgi:hypothetical protein
MTAEEELLAAEERQIEVVRAAVASILAAESGVIASRGRQEAADFHQSLMLAPGGPFGYEMRGELVALERLALHSDGEGLDAEGNESVARGLTRQDEQLSEVTAFLFDHLINLVLPAGLVAPGPEHSIPANEPYEWALRSADFAGQLLDESAAGKEAEALLFTRDENGNRRPSEKYASYLDFELKVEQTRARLRDLPPDARDEDRAVIQQVLERLQADWLMIGHKRLVEAAIQTILREDQVLGFEDERKRLLERLVAKKVKRLDAAGQSYAHSQLFPLMPLLDGIEGPSSWRRFELTSIQLRGAFLQEIIDGLGLTWKELEAGLEGLDRLSFEFLSVSVVREWMDERFFSARYWRLPDGKVFSDGKGGGVLPGYCSSMLFIRNLQYVSGVIDVPPEDRTHRAGFRFMRMSGTTDSKDRMEIAEAMRMAKNSGLVRSAKLLEARENEKSETVRLGTGGTLPPRPETAKMRSVGGLISRIFPASMGRLSARKPPGGVVLGSRTFEDHVRPSFPELEVEVTEDQTEQSVLDGLKVVVSVPRLIALMEHTEIRLQKSRTNRLNAIQQIPTKRRSGVATAELQDSRGRKVASCEINLAEDHIRLKWKVAPNQIGLIDAVPTLFAYIATPVPPSPNPDPALKWST